MNLRRQENSFGKRANFIGPCGTNVSVTGITKHKAFLPWKCIEKYLQCTGSVFSSKYYSLVILQLVRWGGSSCSTSTATIRSCMESSLCSTQGISRRCLYHDKPQKYMISNDKTPPSAMNMIPIWKNPSCQFLTRSSMSATMPTRSIVAAGNNNSNVPGGMLYRHLPHQFSEWMNSIDRFLLHRLS